MKFTLGWLKEHLDTSASLDEIVSRLTSLGIEVEEVTDRGRVLAPFTVAEIVEAKPHPHAERLQVCTVDTGGERLQVVCGAGNARAGLKGVFAAIGATIPGSGMKLKRCEIRGVESHGMMCSAWEMGLGDDHEGIIELPQDLELGRPFAEALGLDDPVIDVSITPNRADCLGVRGIARDLAAARLGVLKPRQVSPVKGSFKSPVGVRFDFPPAAEDACPMFVARYIRGVKNGESPAWLKNRLAAVGLRPISALVDISNFFTLDLARPLHVFDADKLKGDLTLRFAVAGESLCALDDKVYALEPGMTVIADETGVLSLGGVIGGESTGCGEETKNVLLECALFDPRRISATGRRLMIESDARYRFERSVDPASVIPGAEAATRMILDLCGGEAGEMVIAGAEPEWRREISFRSDRVAAIGGLAVGADEIRRILEALGFTVGAEHDGRYAVSAPSWRADAEGEADLVEEILRVYGYDRITALSFPRETALPKPVLTPRQQRERFVRRELAARGLVEAVTWSFMDGALAKRFGGDDPDLRLMNPISSDLDVMRPSVLPNLIAAAGRNMARGEADFALFEVGPTYADNSPRGQRLVAAGLRVGNTGPRHWSGPLRAVDAFDAKADALAALAAAGAPAKKLKAAADAPDWYHPGRSGSLRLAPDTVLAHFGELHPEVLARVDVKGPVAGFELFLDAVPEPEGKSGKARPLMKPSPLQPLERDFAFVVDAGVSADEVVVSAAAAASDLITDVGVFDLYEGEGIGEGEKSIAFTVTLQPTERTLTLEEIDEVTEKVITAVVAVTDGRLRG